MSEREFDFQEAAQRVRIMDRAGYHMDQLIDSILDLEREKLAARIKLTRKEKTTLAVLQRERTRRGI